MKISQILDKIEENQLFVPAFQRTMLQVGLVHRSKQKMSNFELGC